jgi:hypothetical protein
MSRKAERSMGVPQACRRKRPVEQTIGKHDDQVVFARALDESLDAARRSADPGTVEWRS